MSSDRVRLNADLAVLVETVEWSPGELASLLDITVATIRRYVVLDDACSVAATLWVAHTHVFEAFATTPYLSVTSAEKRCGKTRLFDVLSLLVARPWRAISPSEAVVFRKIQADRPTLLLDEVDAIFGPKANGNAEALRSLLNAGNRRGTTVPRCVGASFTLTDFNTFCPKALAGIGELPETVADRSVPIRLKRKSPGEQAERFRQREALEVTQPLAQSLASWAAHAAPSLAEARPAVPEVLNDRAEEAWEPLLAIADLAGEAWAERARLAAVSLSTGQAQEDESIGVRLLADIFCIFDTSNLERMPSAQLAEKLAKLEEAPWGDLRGRPLDSRGLARRLKRYEIHPKVIRVGTETARGYAREVFEDAWSRYLPSNASLSVTSATLAQPCAFAGDSATVTPDTLLRSENGVFPLNHADVTGVAHKQAEEEADRLRRDHADIAEGRT